MSKAWLRASASDLGRSIAAGKIDPVDLTEVFLAEIEVHDLTPRIYARMTEDRARKEAMAAGNRARAGRRRGLLDGVPVSWKDLFDTAGTATEAGSALLKGRVPDRDARILRAATAAGLVCLGKTHMAELAFSGLGLNPITQTPPCVNNPAAVPGGSSSGAATSVAFGLAAAAIGSDTGGSVRIPAAWNDLVGLKTTHGLLSLDGVVPLCLKFDTVGPLCRSVEDAARLLGALGGGPVPDLAGANLKGRTFMVLETAALDDLRPEPARGFEKALDAIAAAGARLVRGNVSEVTEALAHTRELYPSEAYGHWKDVIEANPDLMYGEIRDRFRSGATVTAPDYTAAVERLDSHRRAWLAATAGYEAVLVPTSPILPPDAARLLSDHDYYVTENLLALRNTRIGNLLGLSALTLPTGVPSTGLMVMTPPFAEARLLRLGAAIEAALA